MNKRQKRGREIDAKPLPYQASLYVIRHRPELATEEDWQRFNYALGADGSIGNEARVIKKIREVIITRNEARKEKLAKRLKEKE